MHTLFVFWSCDPQCIPIACVVCSHQQLRTTPSPEESFRSPHHRTLKENSITCSYMDNFSKIITLHQHRMDAGAFKAALWTGLGFKVFNNKGKDFSLHHRHDDNGGMIPAMPDDIFSLTEDLMTKMSKRDDEGVDLLEGALCTKYSVNTCPPKPIIKREDDAQLYATLASHPDGMSWYHPEAMIGDNIGSKKGLMHILRRFVDEKEIGGSNDNYHMMSTDMAIYVPIMKVGTHTQTGSLE